MALEATSGTKTSRRKMTESTMDYHKILKEIEALKKTEEYLKANQIQRAEFLLAIRLRHLLGIKND